MSTTDTTTNPAIVGSTLTPSGTIAPEVITNKVATKLLVLNDRAVLSVTDDGEARGYTTIPSMEAIHSKFETVETLVAEAQALVDQFNNPWIISDPLLDPHFMDNNWVISGNSTISDGTITLKKSSNLSPYAYLLIGSSAFTTPGVYYLELKVGKIPSGAVITVSSSTVANLATVQFPGVLKVEFDVAIPASESITIAVTTMSDDDAIELDYCYLYSVRNSMTRYMTYILEKSASGGETQLVSLAQCNALIEAALTQAKTYSDDVGLASREYVDTHTSRKDNPHGTTPVQIGAADRTHNHTPEQCASAPAVHTHAPTDCGAAPTIHTHTPDQCGAAPTVHAHSASDITLGDGATMEVMVAHLADGNNPHGTNATQVGLGNLVNSRTSDIVDSETSLANIKAVYTVNQSLSQHKVAINPHGITPAVIGLGNVPNVGIATYQETYDGDLTDKLVNPSYLKQAVTAWSTEGTDLSKMQATPIMDFTVNDTATVIPLIADRIYRLYFQGDTTIGLDTVTCKFIKGDTTSPTCDATYTYTTPSIAPYIGYKATTATTSVNLLPPDTGHNFGVGELIVDTSSFLIHGTFNCGIGSVSGDITQTPVIKSDLAVSIHTTTLNDLSTTKQSITSLSIVAAVATSVNVKVYEYVETTKGTSLLVDAFPVGHMTSTLATTGDVSNGYCLLDGSELSRTTYKTLFDYASTHDLIVTETEWQTLSVNGTKDVPKFSYGTTADLFRIPKRVNLNDPFSINVIKISDVVIPNATQILYKLVASNSTTV